MRDDASYARGQKHEGGTAEEHNVIYARRGHEGFASLDASSCGGMQRVRSAGSAGSARRLVVMRTCLDAAVRNEANTLSSKR